MELKTILLFLLSVASISSTANLAASTSQQQLDHKILGELRFIQEGQNFKIQYLGTNIAWVNVELNAQQRVINCNIDTNAPLTCSYMSDFYVKKIYRKYGLGFFLFKKIVEYLRSKNITTLYWIADPFEREERPDGSCGGYIRATTTMEYDQQKNDLVEKVYKRWGAKPLLDENQQHKTIISPYSNQRAIPCIYNIKSSFTLDIRGQHSRNILEDGQQTKKIDQPQADRAPTQHHKEKEQPEDKLKKSYKRKATYGILACAGAVTLWIAYKILKHLPRIYF